MSERPVNPWLKQALELGPPLLFFAAYLLVRDETYTIGGTEYGGFIVAGDTSGDVFLVKTDGEGHEIWGRRYGTGDESGYSVSRRPTAGSSRPVRRSRSILISRFPTMSPWSGRTMRAA